MPVERQVRTGQEVIIEGEKIRLRPGLIIVGELENGQCKYGPGVRKEGDGTIVQDGQWWKSWATPPIQYSSEAITNDPALRAVVRDFSPLHGIQLFSSPSKRFG